MTNKQDPASLARSLVDGARTSSLIEEGRMQGKSDESIVKDIFSDYTAADYEALDGLFLLMTTLGDLQKEHGLPRTEDVAYGGLIDIMSHRLNTEPAIAVRELLEPGTTVSQIRDCFLKLNELED
jgi:hypothetical protein